MFTRRIALFRLLGFQVWMDWSWLILALLVTWSLATGLFPVLHEDAQLSQTVLWSMGAAGALGLFASIVLHELGHSIIARRFGMQMRGITLFIFGGVAEMTDEPPSARAEFFVAIAGPIVSVIIGAGMLVFTVAGTALDLPVSVLGVTGWLGWINFILVAFNLIPAFPLDGGRVLRAILWHLRSDLRWATRITASIGGFFGIMLIVLGVLSILGGNFVGGLWWIVLGIFLRSAASASYQHVIIRRALEGEPVSRFMTNSPIVVSPDLSIRQLIDEYFYRYYHKMYPVVSNGTLTGCVRIADVKSVPQDQWQTMRISEIAESCSNDNTIRADADAMQAMAQLNRAGSSRLLVVDASNTLIGVLSLKDLLQFISLKTELEDLR